GRRCSRPAPFPAREPAFPARRRAGRGYDDWISSSDMPQVFCLCGRCPSKLLFCRKVRSVAIPPRELCDEPDSLMGLLILLLPLARWMGALGEVQRLAKLGAGGVGALLQQLFELQL